MVIHLRVMPVCGEPLLSKRFRLSSEFLPTTVLSYCRYHLLVRNNVTFLAWEWNMGIDCMACVAVHLHLTACCH